MSLRQMTKKYSTLNVHLKHWLKLPLLLRLFLGEEFRVMHMEFCSYRCLLHSPLSSFQSTLNFSNPNFFSMLVESVSSQVLYMKKVIGTRQLSIATTILPLSKRQVGCHERRRCHNANKRGFERLSYCLLNFLVFIVAQVNYTVSVEIGSSAPYV